MDFKRELYFSQMEACKNYNISRATFRKICKRNNIEIIENEITYQDSPDNKAYVVTTVYVKKIDFIKANI